MTNFLVYLVSASVLLFLPAGALAGELGGRVLDSKTDTPIQAVSVSALDGQGREIGSVVTDEEGAFRFSGLSGEVTLSLTCTGYATTRLEGVRPGTPEVGDLLVKLEAEVFPVDRIVVTVSRRRETQFEAPASVTVIDRSSIEEKQRFTPTDELQTTPGINFSRKGILSSTYNSRGRAGVNNGNTLILQDYRYTRLPFLQYNIPYLLSPTTADIDRIEVIRGPNAALYGPEGGGNGVVHIVTRSPFDSQGTTLSIGGGEQSFVDGWLRHAGVLGGKLGYTISGRYTSADDWTPSDSMAATSGDMGIRAGGAQARLEWRASDETSLHFTSGIANVFNQVEQVPTAYFQEKDFRFWYLQPMLKHKKLKINLMYNENSMGESYILPEGQPVVDDSQLFGAQVQEDRVLETGTILHSLSYGLDWRNTRPKTGGTLTGRFEDNDTITEIGAYLQSTAAMNSRLDLVGSIRVDYHDRVDEGVALPFRLGAVYRPKPSQVVRMTFNRMTEAPPNVLLFSDIYGGGQFPY
jgi:iron complex outermembrane receptor protein